MAQTGLIVSTVQRKEFQQAPVSLTGQELVDLAKLLSHGLAEPMAALLRAMKGDA